MILTCPSCASSYFVDDDMIGPSGRTVRCASCGERWFAREEAAGEQASDAPEMNTSWDPSSPVPLENLDPDSDQDADRLGAVEAQVAGADSMDVPMFAPPRSANPSPKSVKPSADFSGLIWAMVGLVLASALVLAAMFRSQVVEVWPKSASAYALVGLAINPTGLTFEKIKAVRIMQDGRAALRVSGAIRNIEQDARDLPPIRIALLDPQGKEVMVQIGRMDGVRIPPRQERYFATVLVEPPAQSRDMSVTFALDGPSRPAKAAPSHGIALPHAP